MRALGLLVSVIGCNGAPAEPPPAPEPATAPAPAGETDEAALARAETAAKALGKTLKTRVVESMGKDGPAGALATCHAEAATLTAGVAAEQGVTVGRSSLRLRNPANAAPEWVGVWLAANGERPAEGVAPLREVVTTASGAEAHVIFPIAVEAPCLACHGGPADVPDDVEALLAEKYPTDAARGYATGDLRGALWASTPVLR